MMQILKKTLLATLLCAVAASAKALVVLPPECQFDPFSEACAPGPGGDPDVGAIVGEAILQKLLDSHPEQAFSLLTSNFVEQWTTAWQSFPVPQVIEAQIAALDPNDFQGWLDWLCGGLHPDPQQPALVDFQQAPPLVISSFTPADSHAVPLPASIWLFASAVLGLAATGKRRSE